MIKFGPWSIVLLLASLHGLCMAVLLSRTRENAAANRCLASLLVLVVLLITPYTIGYAGFYDAYPWLTFAPFFWQLGFGPLIYLYVRQLGSVALPRHWRWHFLPLAVQVAYYGVLFCLPLEAKWRWNDAIHGPWIVPLQNTATFVSLALYLWLSVARYRAYQAWLADNAGVREEFRLTWLVGFLTAICATLLVAAAFAVTHALVRALSYFDEFPLYVVFALLVYYLGIEGWRHAKADYPRVDENPTANADDASVRPVAERDWSALGRHYRERVVAAGWWREPDIDLSDLARRLGTNTNYLSRSLNDGLGLNFSRFINQLRIDAAKDELLKPGEILAVALEVGFRSKASFNRAFKDNVGCTPSDWRARAAGARIET